MAQKKARSKAGVKARKAGRGAGEIERYEKALEAFDRAIKALYKGEADKAKEQLEKLKESYGDETELLDRVSSYLAICERKLSPPKKPKTTEEMVTQGVFFHNSGDSQQAVKVLSKALEMDPSNPYIAYCLAAAHARAGDASEAAKHLKLAIQADSTSRVHALSDEDFAAIRDRSEIASVLAGA
jgi:tetratricopeptide (TPR) repeat protein